MKKVTKSPLVLDVLNLPGVQKSLERLADLLGKIQKALGEYLERERASFPRYTYMYMCMWWNAVLYIESSDSHTSGRANSVMCHTYSPCAGMLESVDLRSTGLHLCLYK